MLAIAAGESIGIGAAGALAVIAAGVPLAAVSADIAEGSLAHTHRATLLAGGAAIFFGLTLLSSGRASDDLPLAWVLLPARVFALFGLTLPLLAAAAGGSRRHM